MSSRPDWITQWVQDQHSETLSQKTKEGAGGGRVRGGGGGGGNPQRLLKTDYCKY